MFPIIFLISLSFFLIMWLEGLDLGAKSIGFYCVCVGGGIQTCDDILTIKNICSVACSFGPQKNTEIVVIVFGGWWQSVKHFQILVVPRMGLPIMENVPTHCGAGSIQGYPKVTPDYPMLSKAIQVLKNVGPKKQIGGPLIGNSPLPKKQTHEAI